MSFREATGRRLDWINTGTDQGFSNFLFVDQHYRSNPVLRRIFSLARKQNFQSLLVEEISEADCALLAEENAAVRLRKPIFEKSVVHRLSFFRGVKDQPPVPADFLGYVIFKSDFFTGEPKPKDYVFEAVVLPSRGVEQNNFIHCSKIYQVKTTLGTFPITGVLYAQQNDLTFVCAHVSLRSALACMLPDGDVSYARLNALAGIDHQNRKVGERHGLGPLDIETILNSLGVNFEKIVHEPRQQLDLPTEFQRDLYGFIESGCPALVGFELDEPTPGPEGSPRHVILVIGHTFNEDTWVPDAQRAYFGGKLSYFPSESWLSSYVVHDDNFGPYYCLPRHFLKKENFRIIYGLKAQATPFNAVEAEAIGFDFIGAIVKRFPRLGQDWYDRFAVFQRCGLLVLRTALVRKEDYIAHLQSLRSRDGLALEPALVQKFQNHLPETFWMVEASAPELFATSRRKFGEILLSAQLSVPKPLNLSLLLAARVPGLVMIRQQNNVPIDQTHLQGHTGLFNVQRHEMPTGAV
jgi:hypothetical protein